MTASTLVLGKRSSALSIWTVPQEMSSTRNDSVARGPPIPWERLLDAVDRYYEAGNWREPVLRIRGASPFLIMVSTILSHRTRDEVTLRATADLLTKYPSPEELSRATFAQIRAIISGVGMSRQKARGLRDAARWIVKNGGGRVPDSEQDLLKIPRVGPKTAHAVMVFGYELPGLPIDVHILRVCHRLGAVKATTIEGAQRELRGSVPETQWYRLNPTLVRHGMNTCLARNPKCESCPIKRWCPRIGVHSIRPTRTVDTGGRIGPTRGKSVAPSSSS